MRAVGYQSVVPIESPDSLVDIERSRPSPAGRDILVKIQAVSVNPVDAKIRQTAPFPGEWKVLGWDGAGLVEEVGSDCVLFKPGDAVFYAGDVSRSGTNAEYHLIDERLVGRKPKNLDWGQAAALPLTSLAAWEALFDRLEIAADQQGALLVVGGAGGVGSMALHLARKLTNLIVVATASRPETAEWAKSLGAHRVIDHSKPLSAQYAALGLDAPAFVFPTRTGDHLPEIAALIAPEGRVCLIDDPKQLDIMPFKRKSVSIHWEWMFTRAMFRTSTMERQGKILNRIADLVEKEVISTTLAERFGPINAANLRRAHALIESGKAKGKIVLEGF